MTAAFGVAIAAIAIWLPQMSKAAHERAADADLNTASMLFIAPNGKTCRQRTIDNRTWQIHEGRPVDCDEALEQSANSDGNARRSGSRVEIIRDAFRHQPSGQ